MSKGMNAKDLAEMFDRRVAELTKTILNSEYGSHSYKESYIPDAKSYRIASISDIKQNGPATIIFLKNGKKVVVKCRDNPQNERMGLYMCLIKYLVGSNRIYSSCVNYIFEMRLGMIDRLTLAEAIILSHIDSRDFHKIVDKFFSQEED